VNKATKFEQIATFIYAETGNPKNLGQLRGSKLNSQTFFQSKRAVLRLFLCETASLFYCGTPEVAKLGIGH
jgi:hypothetical protein